MKKFLLIVLIVAIIVPTVGCWGPNQLSRKFDDWTNQQYVDSPWLSQLFYYVGVIPVGTAVTWIVDGIILNPIDFWGESAFRGKGTGFEHKPATGAPQMIK